MFLFFLNKKSIFMTAFALIFLLYRVHFYFLPWFLYGALRIGRIYLSLSLSLAPSLSFCCSIYRSFLQHQGWLLAWVVPGCCCVLSHTHRGEVSMADNVHSLMHYSTYYTPDPVTICSSSPMGRGTLSKRLLSYFPGDILFFQRKRLFSART